LNDVVDAVQHGTATLVDARTSEEYADGRIPGAINIPFLDNAEPDSGGRWKSPAALRAMYADKGVTQDKPIISYCSTGVRSAVTWLTLSALGFPNIRLYSASFAEWSSDPTRPVRTGIG
jgi:thiosulfate/3-mercaptopyruvate sulfurtransferase